MYRINEVDKFKYLTFSSLEKYDELFHCFTTRHGGVSTGAFASMNLGMSTGDEKSDIEKNYEILSEKLYINLENMVKSDQTHSSNIKYVNDEYKGRIFDEKYCYTDVDGLITDKKNIALATSHADCTPIFFYDSIKKIIGMAHAGWRGTVDDIAGKMADRFINDFNSNPEDINAVIGPSLGQCCFEVDEDVYRIFMNINPEYKQYLKVSGSKYYFDLWAINKSILIKKGLNEENIETAGLCTKCNNDLFFSHRGQKGKRGIMLGIIMMK